MLETTEVNEASNVIHEAHGYRQLADMQVLYHQEPEDDDTGTFIEIRRWATMDGEASDLICEYGALDADGELHTKRVVLPFHWGLYEALNWVRQRFLAENMKGVTVR